MAWIGVDPGESGSIACIFESGVATWVRLNETAHDVSEWIRDLVTECHCRAVIERVNAMPKQGVSSSFKFGMSYGFLTGLLVAHQVPFVLATPQRWQAEMACRTKGNKNVSKSAAQRLWPTLKITHANADALLIAEYCRRLKE
jgi:crossover junction endodeoxyribonuclease RuvC